MPLTYETVDVFTDQAFGGNPLAVVFGGEDLNAEAMQAITREFNYSESTFVLPPRNPAHTAQVRIFTPTREVPLRDTRTWERRRCLLGEERFRQACEEIVFEEEAGLVPISVRKSPDGDVLGAMLTSRSRSRRYGSVRCGGRRMPWFAGRGHPHRCASAGLGIRRSSVLSGRVGGSSSLRGRAPGQGRSGSISAT